MKIFKHVLLLTAILIATGVKAQINDKTELPVLKNKEADSLVYHVCGYIKNLYYNIERGK